MTENNLETCPGCGERIKWRTDGTHSNMFCPVCFINMPRDPEICTACNGSGEGNFDGSRCPRCGGRGEIDKIIVDIACKL